MTEQRTAARKILCTVSVLGGLTLFAASATAQDMMLPGSADPARVLENQQSPVRPQQDLEVEPAPKRAVPVVPKGMEDLTFVLSQITFEGMTAYSEEEVRHIYQRYIGKEISVAILFNIMASVQQQYLDDGYALTKVVIPNQNINDGQVSLRVIEGHVSEVELDPSLRASPALDDAVARIRGMRPLNVKTLERVMLLLNDLPDANISAILASPLKPSKAGGVRLVLQRNAEKEKIGSIGADNHGSIFTGPLQARANARAFHVGPAYSELSASVFGTAQLMEQRGGAMTYKLPLFGISGAELLLSASKAWTEPGSDLDLLDIKGISENLGIGLSYPVIRQRAMNLNLDAGFEWKNSRTKILGEELYDDRLRVLKAGFNFNASDSLAGYNLLDLHYSQGLNILGVRESGSIDLSRQDGRTDFSKMEFLAGRIQGLPRNFELFTLVSGQYSWDPLLSSEEFGFGGGQLGRGYDASEITGDRGVGASVELRYKTAARAFSLNVAVQPYIFYDIGKVWNIDRGAKDKVSAASAGAGVRFNIENDWDVDFSLATPLTKSADNEPKYQNDTGARFLVSISRSF